MTLPSDPNIANLYQSLNLGTEALDAAKGASQYVSSMFRGVATDAVGAFFGDRLRIYRWERAKEMLHDAEQRLSAKGIPFLAIASPSVVLPILEGGADEVREELKVVWTALLAAAFDPSKTRRVSRSFIETVRLMEPIDALVMREITVPNRSQPSLRDHLTQILRLGPDEVEVSLQHLIDLKVAHRSHPNAVTIIDVELTAYGRELARLLEL